MKRKLYIHGEITDESFSIFSRELDELNETKGRIDVELMSGGGDTYAALAYYGKIRTSKNPIRVTAYGKVMSAATLILVCAHERRMHKEAWFMLHDDSFDAEGMSPLLARTESEHHEIVEQQWADLLAKHASDIDGEAYRALSADTTYWLPDECLEHGVIDEVIE